MFIFIISAYPVVYLLIFKDFIYLFERERAQAGRGIAGEGEAGFLLSKEPNAGLDPRTL